MKTAFAVIIISIPLFMAAEQTTIGYLGILSEPINEAMMTALKVEYGVLVTKVYENTPADKAGIEIGDVIYEIDGEKIIDVKSLKEVVADRPNKKVAVKLLHSGTHIKKSITLDEKEKEILKLNIEIPDMDDFKKTFEMGREEFKVQLENLEKEVELLKKEIEEIKQKMQEQ